MEEGRYRSVHAIHPVSSTSSFIIIIIINDHDYRHYHRYRHSMLHSAILYHIISARL